MDTQHPLAGKTALVTGASRNLGAEIARTLWGLGANLILVARQHKVNQSLYDLAVELGEAPVLNTQSIESLHADLAMPSGVNRVTKRIGVGDVDILINNAAIQGPVGLLENNDWLSWRDTNQVNELSPVELCRAVLPHMKEQKWGKIVNLSGGGAAGPRPEFTAYATSKAGLVRFSESLAQEVSAFNIDINCVAPGEMGPMDGSPHPISEIDKAVQLIQYLCSPESNGITGKLISAVHDTWWKQDHLRWAMKTDAYTLRRVNE
jgi:3-oxoacyl-[acyl-carrier protein] reductase